MGILYECFTELQVCLPFDLIERRMQGQLMTAKEYFAKPLENIYPFCRIHVSHLSSNHDVKGCCNICTILHFSVVVSPMQ